MLDAMIFVGTSGAVGATRVVALTRAELALAPMLLLALT